MSNAHFNRGPAYGLSAEVKNKVGGTEPNQNEPGRPHPGGGRARVRPERSRRRGGGQDPAGAERAGGGGRTWRCPWCCPGRGRPARPGPLCGRGGDGRPGPRRGRGRGGATLGSLRVCVSPAVPQFPPVDVPRDGGQRAPRPSGPRRRLRGAAREALTRGGPGWPGGGAAAPGPAARPYKASERGGRAAAARGYIWAKVRRARTPGSSRRGGGEGGGPGRLGPPCFAGIGRPPASLIPLPAPGGGGDTQASRAVLLPHAHPPMAGWGGGRSRRGAGWG